MADLAMNFSAQAAGTSSYGDLLVVGGDLALTGGQAAIEQAIAQRLRTMLGEWFLDTSIGVPYVQDLFGRRGPTAAFEASLQSVVLSTPGVVALLYWKTERDTAKRRLTVTFRAQSTAGEVVWSGNLNPASNGA